MRNILTLTLAVLSVVTAWATPDFDTVFADSTLRIDYILGGAPDGTRVVLLSNQQKTPGWAGRRHNLNRFPAHANGQVVMRDHQSGDTLYCNSFNTLFQEWLVSSQADHMARAWEQVCLLPLPKNSADITLTLFDSQLKEMASTTHTYEPTDILVKSTAPVAPEHRYLHRGTISNPIDVAILPEGYTTTDKEAYFAQAQAAADAILEAEPFRSNRDAFNFVAVWQPSEATGVSVPKNSDWKNTAFQSHFSTFYADRYLTSNHLTAMHDALAGIPYEHIIVLANVEEYGGGGFFNSNALTAALNERFLKVIVHEFGHSFGALADEYFYDDDMSDTYPLDTEPWEANITTLVDFSSKWADMLPDGLKTKPVVTHTDPKDNIPQELGLYEGAGYTSHGVYRPVDYCIMRNNSYAYPFCPVCNRALRRMINFYTK